MRAAEQIRQGQAGMLVEAKIQAAPGERVTPRQLLHPGHRQRAEPSCCQAREVEAAPSAAVLLITVSLHLVAAGWAREPVTPRLEKVRLGGPTLSATSIVHPFRLLPA